MLHGMAERATIHVPVLPREVMEWLEPRPGQVIVDGTLGGGGHTLLLAERISQGADAPRSPYDSGFVLALDRDPAALAAAEKSLAGLPVKITQANFCELGDVLDELGIAAVDGVLLDLGLSSDQLADASRGFSFDAGGELDLRFNTDEGEPAWRLLARLKENEIAGLIYEFGEERYSRRIARRIVEARAARPIRTAGELADLVRRSIPRSADRIDSATRTFQALRIAVNRELESLELALARIPDRLKPGGRLAIISFHSLEDRRVKEAFRDDPRLENLTKKPIRPSDEEQHANPRSRSAKLRVAQRVT
ncbi:MAG: 16S rRNA (cytosine(1402)-N(4))-methyltransferase RsmH [Planctomycetaceae bacterium]|nr:16S rRNA (cytosine(1402)-N(4))-methyltransferase RsmH [Planctomycetaceae bacterium]